MKALLYAALSLALLAGLPGSAGAHEVRPGYLELRAVEGDAWDVLWKVPAKGDLRLGLYVRLPDSCEGSEPVTQLVGGAHVERWRVRCASRLSGESIRIEGLSSTRTDVLVRVKHAEGGEQTVRLTPSDPAFRVTRAPGGLSVAATYLGLGVEHILLGVDHLLFVLALLFLVGGARRLIGAVTAFTAAHSLTLAAATLGWIHVPPAPVEAAIALSIVFVAAEIVRGGGLAARKPWLVAFCFGLLHGFGFASALSQVGLPDHAIPVALALFNLGVELGQLLFIAAVALLLALASRLRRPFAQSAACGLWDVAALAARPAAYAIGSAGAFWLIERTASFWSA